MKRFGLLLFFSLFVCVSVYSQNTSVSGTITDAGGQAWNNGTYTFNFVPSPRFNGTYRQNGTAFAAPRITGNLSPTATFTSISVPDNNLIFPVGTQWSVTVCVQTGTTCFTSQPFIITGASQDVSANVIPPTIFLTCSYTTALYADSEVSCTVGGTYYNLTSGVYRVCQANTGVNCTTWSNMGGGGIPGIGSVQCNSAGAFAACPDITDVGGVVTSTASQTVTNALTSTIFVANSSLTVNGDSQLKGPNPYIDVTRYGARAINPNTAPATDGITASITGQTATLSSASSFVNGDGVVIREAGANNTLATPSAPTVQSVLMAAPLGTPETFNAPAGSTTYNYQVIARTKLGGYTAASATGSTTTGQATLGINSATVSSSTLSGLTVTVNTSAPTSLVPGAMVWVPQSGNVQGAQLYRVQSTPTSSQFTFFQQGLDSIGAGPAIGAGSLNYIVCNHVTWPTVTNAWQYYVYLSGTLIGTSRPGETYYDDCGATIRGNPVFPTYISTSAPGAATNDPLVTTIVSGAGTTTLTLANAASNTVVGKTIRFDDAPAFRAAFVASNGGTPLYIPTQNPPPSGTFYVINSFLDLTGIGSPNIEQSGNLFLSETMQLNGTTYWEGNRGGGYQGGAGFGWDQYRNISIRAYPGIYLPNGNNNYFEGLFFGNPTDGALNILMDVGFNDTFRRCYFLTGTSGIVDYLGIGAYFRGVSNVLFDHTSLVSNMPNTLAMGPWAGMATFRSDLPLSNNSGHLWFRNVFTASKSIVADYTAPLGVMQGSIDQLYSQGARTPLMVLYNNSSLFGSWTIKNVECDTTGAPVFSNLTISSVALGLESITGSSPGCPNVSGNTISNLTSSTGAASFQNTDSASLSSYSANDGTRGFDFTNRYVNVRGPGVFQHAFSGSPATPILNVVAGGSLSVAQHCYQYQWNDINNNGGQLSAIACATTTGGNQTITIGIGVPPAGAFGVSFYRDGTRAAISGFCIPQIQIIVASTVSDTGVAGCGQSPFVSAGTADSGIRNQNIFSPSYTLIDPNITGFLFNTAVPTPLTATRQVKWPDADVSFQPYNLPVTRLNDEPLVRSVLPQNVYDNFTRANGALGANWTANTGTLSITSNQVTSIGARSVSNWTGSGFVADQFSEVTLTTTPGNAGSDEAGVVVRALGAGISTFYLYRCRQNDRALFSFITGSFGGIGNTAGSGCVAGDVIRLEIQGSTLVPYRNGSLDTSVCATVTTCVNSSITSGSPGIDMSGATTALDNFNGGNLHPLAHLDLEQDWVTSPQHFMAGFTVGSTTATPINKLLFEDCGTTSTCAQTQQAQFITIKGGPIAMVAGAITITSLPYTSATSYVCSPDDSTGINGIDVVYNSGTSVTFNGTGTDSIRYSCSGN